MEAEADSNASASLIAAAPDMFELLEILVNEGSISEEVHEEIQLVLRRARGDFGLAVFSPQFVPALAFQNSGMAEVHGRPVAWPRRPGIALR